MRQNAILSCILLVFHNVCCDQDNWIEPHAWSELSTDQHYNGWEETCSCPAAVPADKSPATIEDQLALMYFKKFVNTLFMRDKLKYSKTLKQYKRSLLFTLRQSQIDELETVQDVRDLDILLASILKAATDVPLTPSYDDYSDMHQGMGVFALITDIFKDFLQLLRKSEVQFMLIVLLIISIGWIVKKRFRYSTLATILGGFFFVFLYGYLFTYLECNRKLEVEAMIDVLDSHQNTTNENSWFSKMLSYLSFTSPEAKQKQKLLKSAKLKLPFCRPDHVFITYMSDTFLKLIEMIIEKSTQSISILSGELSMPFKWIAPVAVVCMVSFMLKLVFQYVISPKAWSGLVHGRSAAPVANTQHAALSNEATTDRLSGDNLKILLNVIGTTTIKLTTEQQQLQMPVSGVQELLEPLEAPPQKVKEKNLVSKISNSSVDIAMDAGFTVVDDNDKDDEQIENC